MPLLVNPLPGPTENKSHIKAKQQVCGGGYVVSLLLSFSTSVELSDWVTQISKYANYSINASKMYPVPVMATLLLRFGSVRSSLIPLCKKRRHTAVKQSSPNWSAELLLNTAAVISPSLSVAFSLCYLVALLSFFFFCLLNWIGDVCQDPVNLRSRCSEADYGNNRNRVTRAGKVNLRRQRVGSAAEEIDFGVYCPAICHTKPLL